MQIKFIKVQETLYKTVGTTQSGYDVYKIIPKYEVVYLGRSQCQTPKMAVNDVLHKSYKRYY